MPDYGFSVSERKEVAKVAGTGLLASFILFKCRRAIPKLTRKTAEKTRRTIVAVPETTAKLRTAAMIDKTNKKR